MSKYHSCQPGRCGVSSALLLAALLGLACGSTDGTILLQPAAGSSGGGEGGSAGAGASSGAGGTGGTTEPRDAGAETNPDGSSSEPSCVVGPLERYCALGSGSCPATYADARAKLRERFGASSPRLILQQACAAPDGSARVRVSGVYPSLSLSYIYDAATEQLVSVQIYDDLGGCWAGERVDDVNFGSIHGFYGEDLPGCSFSYSNFVVPAACGLPADWAQLDAGTLRAALVDAGLDAGSLDDGGPYECILAP